MMDLNLIKLIERRLKVKCCKNECTLKAAKPDFVDKVAQWRKAWILSPAKLKRQAVYAHLLSCVSAKRGSAASANKSTGSAASVESATEKGFAEKDGRLQLVLTATSPKIHYSFLGEDCCRRAFGFSLASEGWSATRKESGRGRRHTTSPHARGRLPGEMK